MSNAIREFNAPFLPVSVSCTEQLNRLVGDWQILSDLSQGDLLLWMPNRFGGFSCAAHCRPATGPTVHLDDVIGLELPSTRQALLEEVMHTGEIIENPVHRWTGMNTVSEVLVPIHFEGRSVGVLGVETNLAFHVGEIGGEGWFQGVAEQLRRMVADGLFPSEVTPSAGKRGNPRVADGAMLLDEFGVVQQASPNALSNIKRLGFKGALVGGVLAEAVTPLLEPGTGDTVDETLAVVLMGRASWLTEIEVRGVATTLRALPLIEDGHRVGALLLSRDVTDKRTREKQLLSKDATIREVHHRVKNNLQTVSALLRLQVRRSDNEVVKDALRQAERRISVISMVHEALSKTVDETVPFDQTFQKLLNLVATAATEENTVTTEFRGGFGDLGAGTSAALALVLTELVTNAVEHGLEERDGCVVVEAQREGEVLHISVMDDGVGLGSGRVGQGLGTQIVQTLVNTELGGTVEWLPRPDGVSGTVVKLTCLRR